MNLLLYIGLLYLANGRHLHCLSPSLPWCSKSQPLYKGEINVVVKEGQYKVYVHITWSYFTKNWHTSPTWIIDMFYIWRVGLVSPLATYAMISYMGWYFLGDGFACIYIILELSDNFRLLGKMRFSKTTLL